jgi:hypothetical protein
MLTDEVVQHVALGRAWTVGGRGHGLGQRNTSARRTACASRCRVNELRLFGIWTMAKSATSAASAHCRFCQVTRGDERLPAST